MRPSLPNLFSVWRWLHHWHRWLLLGLWVAMQSWCWFAYQGPRLNGDGYRYLECATYIDTTGLLPTGHCAQYVGYTLFLSLFLKTGLLWAALTQVFLSGAAACALYATVRRLSYGHWPTAALATLLFVGWLEIQAFNPFLLTESLFTTLLIFSLWAVARVRSWGRALVALGLLLLTASMRPNGFIALGAAALASLICLYRYLPRPTRYVLWPLGVAGIAGAWLVLNQRLKASLLLYYYQQGLILFEYGDTSIQPAQPLLLPDTTLPALEQVSTFVWFNLQYFGQLVSRKLTYFMGFPRPWYSPLHTFFVIISLPLLYFFGVRGLANLRAPQYVHLYLAVVILLQMSIVSLVADDWGPRFSGPILPYWFTLAALGAQPLLRKMERRLQASHALAHR